MALNIEKAVKYVIDNAETGSIGKCARYVRRALEAGGADLSHHPVSAKNYGPTLLRIGFNDFFYWDGSVGCPVGEDKTCRVMNQSFQYEAKKGDVIVIQPYDENHPHGHIALYTGSQWVSDFKQRDMWAGPSYRKHQPPFMIYRP